MATRQFGDIVIAPRVLEKLLRATAKVEGVYSLENKRVFQMAYPNSLWTWRLQLHTERR